MIRRIPHITATILFGVAVLSLAAAPAFAQNWERAAPKQPPANAPATAPKQTAPAPAVPDGKQVILPALKGLIFVPSVNDVRRTGATTQGMTGGLMVRGVDVLDHPDFRAAMAPYLGQPLTLDRLNDITRAAVLFFREHDRPLVDVIVPEQDISGGVVQILALEFRAGSIAVEGARWFSDDQLLSQVRTAPGDRISAESLLADINWLNQNPFRRVDLVYQRGEKSGTSDVVLRTADRFPLRAFGGYENTGTATTGRDRIFTGFNWGNAFWADQQISYQLSASPDFWEYLPGKFGGQARSLTHSGSWFIPLPWRHKLTIFGSHTISRPDVGPDFNQTGRSSQASARYAVPLPALGKINHELQVGTDWKRSNNDLEFGGSSVFSGSSDVAQAMFGYAAGSPDPWGASSANVSVFLSPGGFNDRNTDAALQTARAGVKARYAYARFGVERMTTLPDDLTWIVRAQGQIASSNLPSSEQLSFGGNSSVRGYAESEALGDQGALLSTELRSPEVSLLAALGKPDMGDRLQGLLFADYGVASPRFAQAAEEGSKALLSVGPGMRYALPPYLTLKFDWGFQLRHTDVGENRFGRPHFGLTAAF